MAERQKLRKRFQQKLRGKESNMEKNDIKKYVYMGVTAVSVIATCILFWYCVEYWDSVMGMLNRIFDIVAPIIYGAVLAYLTSPIYNRVVKGVRESLGRVWKDEKHVLGISKAAGTVVSLAVVLLVVAGLIQMLIPQMLESLKGLRDSFPVYLQNLYAWIQKVLADNPDIEMFVLNNLQSAVEKFQIWVENSFINIDMDRLAEFLTGVSSSVLGLLEFIKNWLIGLIVMVYLLNIKDVLIAQSKKIVYSCLSIRWANCMIEEMRLVNQMFGGFIIGKLVDSLIIGIICFVGVSLMNMPFPLLISVIVGVTNVIPFFGPFFGAVPSGFLVLLVSPMKCLYFLLWILLLQQFDGNILGPKILGNSTGLSSFWVLFSILLFGGLFGFVGMIIAVPFFAVIYDLIARAVHHSLNRKKLSMVTEDYKDLNHIDEKDGKFIK